AGNVAKAPATQDSKHCYNQSPARSVGQPRLFAAIAGGRTRVEPETQNRPSDFTPSAGLSKKRSAGLGAGYTAACRRMTNDDAIRQTPDELAVFQGATVEHV